MGNYLASKWDRLKLSDCECIENIDSFDDWLLEIVSIDNQANNDLKRVSEMAADTIAKCQCLAPVYDTPVMSYAGPVLFYEPHDYTPPNNHPNHFCDTGYHNRTFNQYQSHGSGPNSILPPSHCTHNEYLSNTSNTSHPNTSFCCDHCPKLLDNEIKLLNEHKGCRKCRRFYVLHTGKDCPNNWPDPTTYRTLTVNMALAAMSNATISSLSSQHYQHHHTSYPQNHYSHENSPLPPHPFLKSSSSSRLSHKNYSSFRGYFPPPAISYKRPPHSTASSSFANDPTTITKPLTTLLTSLPSASVNAVLPSTSNFVLEGDDHDSDDNISSIIIPHLMWRANIWGKDKFQIIVDCMLNNSSELVLIRPELVVDLGLLVHKLFKPICITLALNGQDTKCTFSNYVSLQLSSLNNAWSSHPIHTLITIPTPQLIKKGFDLLHVPSNTLNPKLLSSPSITLSPKTKRKSILDCRKLLLAELKLRCSQRLDELTRNNCFKTIIPFDLPSAISATIEILASKDKLICLEKELKAEFHEIFEPIPHISLLPTTETACIQLKDAYKKIATRQYSVPRQFRESFALLIQNI
ncbi:hypothetical protein BYT27DRAFT_7259057 [Phlegmacium glaucopus]|nr:hypothetical protein BYT27DRAFT_7259057 [Phlegmacium glaucopus]